jgi:glycosyltransferase involved in cell wall biosynthesis
LSENRHITVFLESLEAGGAEYAVVTLVNAFIEKGNAVELILCKSGGVFQQQLSPGVILEELNLENLYYCLPKLVKYLRNRKPSVLLTTLDLASLMVLVARRLAQVKTRVIIRVANTVSLQERIWLKKKLEHLMLKWIYPWADEIVAVSDGVADDLSVYAGIRRERITTIYNPIITPMVRELANERLNHPWFEADYPVVLGVGRLTRQKDFETLIRAFSKVRLKHDSRLLILGEGEQRAYLEDLVHRLSLDDMVALPGFVENPFKYMKNASVFVLSSRWEGLPGVLIQALACGCPIVSTDCPNGPSEILGGGKYGRLVAVGDPKELADAIEATLDNNHLKPPASLLDQFRVDQVVLRYLSVMGIAPAFGAKPEVKS